MKVHKVTSNKTGKTYEVKKMRTEDSFNLPIYHAWQHGKWECLHGADTLAEVRRQLHAD